MPRAIQIAATGGPEQLQLADVNVGEPGPGDIRIRHHACGLNYIDVYHRTGLYPLQLPHGIGMEGAGVVEAVGPGVTGWTQVNGRNALSWEDKFALDVWYVDNRSFWLDLKILAMTAGRVFSGSGVSKEGFATTEQSRGTAGK